MAAPSENDDVALFGFGSVYPFIPAICEIYITWDICFITDTANQAELSRRLVTPAHEGRAPRRHIGVDEPRAHIPAPERSDLSFCVFADLLAGLFYNFAVGFVQRERSADTRGISHVRRLLITTGLFTATWLSVCRKYILPFHFTLFWCLWLLILTHLPLESE